MRVSLAALSFALAGLCAPGAVAQSLSETLALAEASNPNLDVGRTQAEIAREALESARAQGRANVIVSGSAGVESTDGNSPFAFQIGERPLGSAQIEASLPVYTGGRIAAGVRSAEAGIASADAGLEALRQETYLRAIAAHLDVRAGRDTVEIRNNNVRLLREQVDAAQARFRVGFITRTDVALAEARLAGAVAGVASAEASLEAFIAEYANITGIAPGDLMAPPPLPPLPATFDEALATALEANPSLQRAREDERAAAEAIEAAEAQGRFQLDVVGTASGQQDFNENFYDTRVSLFARGRLPLYQGGQVNSAVRTAKLQRQQARFQVQAAERDIQAALASAWYGYLAAERAVEASARQVDAAQVAFDGARQELAAGTRTTLDVLDSEQDLLDARLAFVNAERDLQTSAYQIRQISGTLTPESVLPTPPAP